MNQKIFNKRVYITGLLILSVACFYIVRLFLLHFSDKIHIQNPYEVKKVLRRGYIKDSNKNILAISIEQKSLFANPEQIINAEEVAHKLSPIINLSEQYILKRITREKRFIWIKRKIDDEIVKKIKSLNIKGLYFKKEFQRVYPHSKLAANIVGFCGVDNAGLEGIEYKFNDILSGEKKFANQVGSDGAYSGNNIILTIDRYIQNIAEKELALQVKESSAKQGAIIITDVNNGKILALAKYPGFDPNKYYRYSSNMRSNYGVVGSFEPGSTMKIFAVAALLRSNNLQLNKKYYCTGMVEIPDLTIKCTGVHNYINITEAIKYSCNVGILDAMKEVDSTLLYGVLRKFGFGEKIGVKLPGESEGILREVKKWSGVSKYSISIGQEMSATLLQLAAAYGAIANGGIYYSLSIIDSIEKTDGTIAESFFPKSRGRILTKNHSSILKKMLKYVVDSGTGQKAKTLYYNVAGKTGTAQKSKRRGGYLEDKYVTSFAGFAPYHNPKICVIVIIDEPDQDASGGSSAAPAFGKVVGKVLSYKGIRNKNIKASNPKKLNNNSIKFTGVNMPNFNGMELADAIKNLIEIQKTHYIFYSINGTGKVVKQYPEAGSKINQKQKIILYLKE